VQTIVDTLSGVVQTIIDKVGAGFNALIATASNVISSIKGFVDTLIDRVVQLAADVFNFMTSKIGDLIDALSNAATGALERLRGVVEDIPKALREMVEGVGGLVGDSVGKPLSTIGEIMITQVEEFFRKMIDELDLSPGNSLREFLTGIGLPADEVDRFANAADKAMPHTPGPFVMALSFLIPFIVSPMVSAILSPAIEEVRQEVAQRVTPTLIPPADTIDAFIRGEMDHDRLRKELGEAGYSSERQDILVASSRRLLGLGDLLAMWLRGFVPEETLDQTLAMQRIAPEDVERLKLAAFPIPPVQDLIRMAVREVFSPEIRERFEQDEGFPEEFATFGAQQGISEFWARAYWAAHWALPSAQQGFEMLHRKVIEPDDLDLLLRALDVMPFWRDKLTAIAFNPLTRVDVRRMHKLGLLTEDDLQERYESLGFSPDDASMMTTFTLAFNADDATEAEREIEGLTRSTAVNMFEDGILEEQETREILQLMGLSERVAGLYVDQRKLEIERNERLALIENIIQLVGGGAINFPTAQDSLATLGLTAVEIAKATKRIIDNLKGRDRLPTLAQLDKMLAAEIITEDTWRETMGGLGFSDDWVDRLFQLNQSGESA
jgi:hypothetical protein